MVARDDGLDLRAARVDKLSQRCTPYRGHHPSLRSSVVTSRSSTTRDHSDDGSSSSEASRQREGFEAARGLSAPVGTALIVGLTSGNWTSASLAGMANLGVTAATCASESRKGGRARQRQNPYYFLHSAERCLAG